MKKSRYLLLSLLIAGSIGSASAEGDKVVREVGRDGVPVITIKGTKAPAPTTRATRAQPPAASPKEWKVYELEGASSQEESKPTVIVVSSPPPIAPNYGYGYNYFNGFGYGFHGFGVPGFPVDCAPFPAGTSRFYANYQNRPINYQNPPVNYQNPPANYRPLPASPGGFRGRCR